MLPYQCYSTLLLSINSNVKKLNNLSINIFAVLVLFLFAWQHSNDEVTLRSQPFSHELTAFLNCYFKFPRGSNFFYVDFTDVGKYKTKILASKWLTYHFLQKLDAFSQEKHCILPNVYRYPFLNGSQNAWKGFLSVTYLFSLQFSSTALKRNALALVMEWSKQQ